MYKIHSPQRVIKNISGRFPFFPPISISLSSITPPPAFSPSTIRLLVKETKLTSERIGDAGFETYPSLDATLPDSF